MSFNKQIVAYNDNLYILLRTIKESSNPIIEDFKQYLNADLVINQNGLHYFLSKIDEAQIVVDEEVKIIE